MREDVLLLHTPHLVFDWYLDSFPGVFDRSMLRSVPYEQRYAENLLSLAIYEMNGQRPMYVDFSTRYSVQFANFGLQQRGIIYGLLPGSPQLVAPQGEVWNIYNWRGITGTEMGFSDLDTQKAILIYASARLESGETLYRLGRKGEGMTELQQAVTIAPTQEVRGQAADILSRYGAP
ncbi:MAG TPA: DUF2723 domain-containing protein, partial [Geobacterales bacterium]|nr:DUF2723 domain-containing protein [Geobacterales bacterium]